MTASPKRSLLDFDREQGKGFAGLIGVDEAGRGPLAGPVVAAAVWLDAGVYRKRSLYAELGRFNDSKQLTEPVREELYQQITQWQSAGLIRVGVAEGSLDEIETWNILGATRLAMGQAVRALSLKERTVDGYRCLGPDSSARVARLLLDGRPMKPFDWKHDGVVKGDGKSLAIAMASVVAKVTRDKLLVEADSEYPHYGFARHKGYGTRAHCDAILKHGACPLHRPSFLKKLYNKERALESCELDFENSSG